MVREIAQAPFALERKQNSANGSNSLVRGRLTNISGLPYTTSHGILKIHGKACHIPIVK